MAKARKTIEVEFIKRKANFFLKHSEPLAVLGEGEDGMRERRKGVASLLEIVLHETGNYKGWNRLEAADGDDTRRVYF